MQNLVEWAREYGRGAYTELHRKSGVAYKLVLKAARDGHPMRLDIAERLHRATGRRVPVQVIRRGVSAASGVSP